MWKQGRFQAWAMNRAFIARRVPASLPANDLPNRLTAFRTKRQPAILHGDMFHWRQGLTEEPLTMGRKAHYITAGKNAQSPGTSRSESRMPFAPRPKPLGNLRRGIEHAHVGRREFIKSALK